MSRTPRRKDLSRYVVFAPCCLSLSLNAPIAAAQGGPSGSVGQYPPTAPPGSSSGAPPQPGASPGYGAPPPPAAYGQAPPPPPYGRQGDAAPPYGAPYYAAPPPNAEPLASTWHPSEPGMIIAVERLVGVFGLSTSESGSNSEGGLTLDLAGNTAFSGLFDPFASPVLSMHGVVGPGVTLGGSIGYLSVAPTRNGNDEPGFKSFTIGPRIGYVAELGPKVALWVKGGVSYTKLTFEGTSVSTSCTSSGVCTSSSSSTSDSASWVDITLDPVLAIFPIPHVALLVGPVADIGVSASSDAGSDISLISSNAKISNYGAAGGLAVFL